MNVKMNGDLLGHALHSRFHGLAQKLPVRTCGWKKHDNCRREGRRSFVFIEEWMDERRWIADVAAIGSSIMTCLLPVEDGVSKV